jgi:ABC-type Mn2+/Zn2+ transport system permease subunit
LIGWTVALIGGIAGLFLSYYWDLPSGAAIVCTFGAILAIVSLLSVFRVSAPPLTDNSQ